MKLSTSLTGAFLVSLLCAIGFCFIAFLVGNQSIEAFDMGIIHFWQDRTSGTLTSVMKVFTVIGSGMPVVIITILIMIGLYFFLHHRKELMLFVFVLVGSMVLNQVLKAVFHRDRPNFARLIPESGYGFPSGHSMGAFSLYGILAFLLWKHIPVLWGRILLIMVSTLLILMIGLSRIYLGVHYPSDVVAGYLASGFWLTASIWIYQERAKRHKPVPAEA